MSWSDISSFIISLAGVCGAIALIWKFSKPVYHWLWRRLRKKDLEIARLRFENTFYEHLCEKKNIAIFKLDEHMGLFYMNNAGLKILKADSMTYAGRRWYQVVDPLELPAVLASWELAYKQQSGYKRDNLLKINSEEPFLVTVRAESYVEHNKVVEFIGWFAQIEK